MADRRSLPPGLHGARVRASAAPGSGEASTRLLEIEGRPKAPRTILSGFDPREAARILTANDPKLGRLIRKAGPFALEVTRKQTPYQWLIRSIIYQQLHAKAAGTIHARVRALFGHRDPKPAELLAMDDARLAGAGLSRQKLAALKDLARAAAEGRVPSRRAAEKLNDEEMIERLLPIRGVGRWTIEMLLIFGLGRADVVALDDFAIKKSAMLLYGLGSMPNRKTLAGLAVNWRPYRSVACWYLWRALD